MCVREREREGKKEQAVVERRVGEAERVRAGWREAKRRRV